MSDQQVGELLDTLGLTLDIDDGQQITEAVIIAKLADFNTGGTGIVLGNTVGLDWIAQRGILSAAWHVVDTATPLERGE